jgi:hypothetical protein
MVLSERMVTVATQDYIGLRFLMADGLFLNWVVSQYEAKQIISGFMNGSLKPIVGNPDAPFGGGWSVRVESVRAIHTVPLEQMQQAAPPPGQQQAPAYGQVPGRLNMGQGSGFPIGM